mgnify:CR=1 FL=1|tara:strand:+ start:12065 stop:13201 length:1137 start_codon:yes stop_codon:yes gene_type:complete
MESWRDVAAKAEGRVESVDDALMGSMSGTGVKQNTGSGLGAQEAQNVQVIEDMKTDDPIDFASMGDELMAGGGMVPSPKPRTPVENVVVSQLSPEDIRSLAQQNKFPKDFDRFPKNEGFILVGDEYVRNPREVYGELKNEFEREQFLNAMKATIDRKIKAEEVSFERFNSDTAAVLKGVAVGAIGAIPILGPAFAAQIPFTAVLGATAAAGIPIATAGFVNPEGRKGVQAETFQERIEKEIQEKRQKARSTEVLRKENELLKRELSKQQGSMAQKEAPDTEAPSAETSAGSADIVINNLADAEKALDFYFSERIKLREKIDEFEYNSSSMTETERKEMLAQISKEIDALRETLAAVDRFEESMKTKETAELRSKLYSP